MHLRILPTIGVSAVALVAAAAFAPMATAGSHPVSPSSGNQGKAAVPHQLGPDAVRPLCFSNILGDTGVGIVSQNFESSFNQYDAKGADNFVLRNKCTATEVDVLGTYFNGSGPARSENVIIYTGSPNNHPGSVVASQTVTGVDTAGSFVIPLTPVHLQPGRYWVSVQVNMDFSSGGEWGWETTSTLAGKPAQWKNPGNGFATGCTTWMDMQTCIGPIGEGPDFIFQIVAG